MNNKKLLFLNFITSIYTMAAQLSLNTALSFSFNNSILVYSFFTGLYLFSMGLGVTLSEKFEFINYRKLMFKNIFLMGLIGTSTILFLIFFNEYHMSLYRSTGISLHHFSFVIGIIITLYLGASAGLELPIISQIQKEDKKFLNYVLMGDYLGNFIGIFLFLFLFFVQFGLIGTIIFNNLILTFFLIIFFKEFQLHMKYLYITIIVFVMYTFLFLQIDNLYLIIDGMSK